MSCHGACHCCSIRCLHLRKCNWFRSGHTPSSQRKHKPPCEVSDCTHITMLQAWAACMLHPTGWPATWECNCLLCACVQVNSPPCSHCGNSDMYASGMAPPTPEEAQGDAGRVEVHTCRACNCTTRSDNTSAVKCMLTS